MLGFACTESGRDSDARDHLRRAIALEPSEPLAPDLLAGVLERGCDYSGAYEVLTRAVATVPRRHAARIHLGRARVLCAQAEESDTESKALLAHALREADHGLQIARTGTMGRHDMANIADAHYHRGVVLHRLGRPRPAGQAFEAARRAGDVHGAAERALTLLGEARGQADGSDRRVRWWGNVLAVVGVLLAVAAVVLEFWHGHWHAAEFRYFPVSYVAGGALLLAVLGAALPRLAGLSFGGQVEIRISEPRAVEPVAVTLAFERADSLPSTIMAGPGAMRIAGPGAMPPPGLPSDTVGNP
jgi:tetratricopeptide (TPR) repeat protein